MNITQITKDILYCGVNDRVKDRFEGLWPLPQGVSYNSYIVRGKDKTALIDTVEIGEISEFFHHIESQIGTAKIDYLVINHMEPDHSGGIPAMLEHYPEALLVGNRQTIAMVKGYYHIPDERFLEIADGHTLDLGGKTLKFFLTPMVHWPETMMTYVEQDRLLFSGDAFGTFGALNGAVLDSDMDTARYRDEMYRYYTNIVGKYGKFVVKAIQKLAGLPIDYIAPTHGPVWHEKIQAVMDIYSRMAEYQSEEGVTIVYGSMYGNTAEIAELIAADLAAGGIRNIRIHNAAKAELSDMIADAFRYKGLIVGSPTYSMHIFPPVEQFMIAMETREIKNKVFGTFGSFTWASASANLLNVYAEKMHLPVVDTIVMKQSSNPQTIEDIHRFTTNFLKSYHSE